MDKEGGGLIFGSYNSRDRETVLSIQADLHVWGIDLWLDTDLAPGTVFGRTLQQKLHDATSAVVFVSGEWGPWQELEIFTLLQKATRDKEFLLIPVLLEGAGVHAGGLLDTMQDIDFRNKDSRPLVRLANALRDGQTGPGVSQVAAGLWSLILISIQDPNHLLKYAETLIRSSQWEEALITCERLRDVALKGRDSLWFATACELSGEVFFLQGDGFEQAAERQFQLAGALFREFGAEGEGAKFERRVQVIREKGRASSGSKQPASAQS